MYSQDKNGQTVTLGNQTPSRIDLESRSTKPSSGVLMKTVSNPIVVVRRTPK